jgi:hypothetical protein
MKNLLPIEDCDLTKDELYDLTVNSRISSVLVLLTANSLRSAPQLFRLGFLHKFATAATPFSPIPIAITHAFHFPGIKALDAIESGEAFAFMSANGDEVRASVISSVIKEASLIYTGHNLTLLRVRSAVASVMETRIMNIDIPNLDAHHIRLALLRCLYLGLETLLQKREEPAMGPMNSIDLDLDSKSSMFAKASERNYKAVPASLDSMEMKASIRAEQPSLQSAPTGQGSAGTKQSGGIEQADKDTQEMNSVAPAKAKVPSTMTVHLEEGVGVA